MRCEEIRTQMVAYLDGELSAEDREIVDSHLVGCPHCREEMTVFESTDDLLSAFDGHILPERDLAAAVLRQAKQDPWCRHIRRELVAFADGELGAEDLRPVEEHLAECGDCRAERDAHLLTARLLGEWRVPDLGVDLVSRVVPARRGPARIRRLVPVLSAACVVIAASLFVILWSNGKNGTLAGYEAVAVEHGVGPQVLGEAAILELAEDLDWVETLPEVDDLAMLKTMGD